MSTPNYYEKLGISISSTEQDIRRAMQKYAQHATSNEDLAILQACKQHLLNAEKRKDYNRALLTENPELFNEMMSQVQTSQQTVTERKSPKTPPTEPEPQAIRPFFKFLLGFIGFLIVLAIVGGNGKKKEKLDEWSAQVACEKAVSDQLKSPASATFSNWTRTNNYNDTFTVTGSVDSQNSFGAMLRSQFSCTVRDNGNQTTTTTVNFLN